MHFPSKHHFGASKRILRYVAGTIDFGIWYGYESNHKLLGFTDSDWAGCMDDRKSTSRDEIQRIKAGNPDISHREAFSAAAKNWAHFPHIQFGLMPDQPVKKTNVRQQEGDEVLMKDGLFAPSNLGVAPY
ncbi:hypothetical protein GH714_018787 [Hevea brasiliensis]|uniref:YABBY protein C-terminal domain-containing protein n=1 Tax=Hevea brasiliensis TaxID=3981 RepID=A0A6A6LPX4_HEVBR|nr:hypothetical protein GH714_018787 [Hevea brasiliensis]